MSEHGILREIFEAAAANATIAAALWGASGGLTSALVVSDEKLRFRKALRHIAIGALVATGGGTAVGAVLTQAMGVPPHFIAEFATGGGVAYLSGVFGHAIIEVLLSRIRKNGTKENDDG